MPSTLHYLTGQRKRKMRGTIIEESVDVFGGRVVTIQKRKRISTVNEKDIVETPEENKASELDRGPKAARERVWHEHAENVKDLAEATPIAKAIAESIPFASYADSPLQPYASAVAQAEDLRGDGGMERGLGLPHVVSLSNGNTPHPWTPARTPERSDALARSVQEMPRVDNEPSKGGEGIRMDSPPLEQRPKDPAKARKAILRAARKGNLSGHSKEIWELALSNDVEFFKRLGKEIK